jgi:molecular chaperone DnaK (HSP70)
VVVSDLPPHKKGELKIEVSFAINTDGILTLTAKDKATDKQIKTVVTSRGGQA